MLIFGILAMLTSAGVGGLLGWQNRDVIVRVRVADYVWSGHLYEVLVFGALLACWFLLGASCIHVRLRERSERRRRRVAPVDVEPAAAARRTPVRRRAGRRGSHVGAMGLQQ